MGLAELKKIKKNEVPWALRYKENQSLIASNRINRLGALLQNHKSPIHVYFQEDPIIQMQYQVNDCLNKQLDITPIEL